MNNNEFYDNHPDSSNDSGSDSSSNGMNDSYDDDKPYELTPTTNSITNDDRYGYYDNTSNDNHYEYNENNPKTPPKSDTLSIVALVLGIISIVMALSCCLTYFCIFPAVAGIICGILAKKSNGKKEASAIAGLVCSGIAAIIFVIVIVLTVLGISYSNYMSPSSTEQHYEESNDPL